MAVGAGNQRNRRHHLQVSDPFDRYLIVARRDIRDGELTPIRSGCHRRELVAHDLRVYRMRFTVNGTA